MSRCSFVIAVAVGTGVARDRIHASDHSVRVDVEKGPVNKRYVTCIRYVDGNCSKIVSMSDPSAYKQAEISVEVRSYLRTCDPRLY